MTSATYQTKVPAALFPFCEAMTTLIPEIERHLYRALEAGYNITDLKREYQKLYGINARQFNGIYATLKGKIKSRLECHKRQLKQLQSAIIDLEKVIKKWRKQVKQTPLACPLKQGDKTPRQLLRWKIHQKQRRLGILRSKLERFKTTKPSLIFGGRKLWNAQFNLEANGYQSHDQWLLQWKEYRHAQFSFVGSKDESAGCQVCQLNEDGELKIRVPAALERAFGKYVTALGIQFAYGQEDIDWALQNHKAVSYRFARKDGHWYLFATVDRPEVPCQSHRRNGILGVDVNPGSVGWSYCNAQGNLQAQGQFLVNLQDRNSDQTKAAMGDVCAQLVLLAQTYSCPIVVESLDFDRKKAGMREQGVRYSRMLSNFAYGCFDAMLISRCQRFGIELVHVNPAYSSFIGLVKFMGMHGMNSATAAAFVLARRALRKSERVPAKSAFGLPEDKPKHVWSYWHSLKKKLVGVRRHDFFNFRAANSGVKVTLLDELATADRSNGKR